MLMLFACVTGEKDTGEAPVHDEWERVTLTPEPFGAVVEGYALGTGGRVVEIGDPWTDRGGSLPDGLRGADANGGALWALTVDHVAEWDGAAWRLVAMPWPVADDLLVLDDGRVALLRAYVDCDDCEGAVVSDELAIWDGAAWEVHEPTRLDTYLVALAELDDGTLVAAGAGGEIAAWDGAEWRVEETGAASLYDVVAVGDEVVAVGAGGAVVRGSPGALIVEQAGTEDLVAVSAGDTVWALGGGSLWRDGWTEVALPDGAWADVSAPGDDLVVVGDDLGPVGLAGEDLDEAWRETALPGTAVWVDEAGAAWTAGTGALGRWDDDLVAWAAEVDAYAVAGSGPDDVVAVGWESLAEWDGTAWTSAATDEDVLLWDVSVAPDGAAFAVGGATSDVEERSPVCLRRTEVGWESLGDVPTAASDLMGVVAFAEDDVHVLTWGGVAEVLHWDGAAWSEVTGDVGYELVRMRGLSGDALWLAGEGLYLWDGADVLAVEGGPASVHDLAVDADALLVAGTDGYGDAYDPWVAEYRDGAWTEVLRASARVGAGGGVQVVVAEGEGWRR
ncbi:MAG: hypothetical protein ACOZNI_09270 [Myxococcota bacterium]